MSQSWDGNASDNIVFGERCQALIEQFAQCQTPRYLIADSKLYTKTNAQFLARLPFITRIPETLTAAQTAIEQAWEADCWQPLDSQHSYYRLNLNHYGICQRWLVIYSESAAQRAKQTVFKAQGKELEKVNQQLFHLQAQRFESEAAALKALAQIAKSWKYHQVSQSTLSQHRKYAQKGRPTQQTPIREIRWQIQAQVVPDTVKIAEGLKRKSCFIVGTSIVDTALADPHVFTRYKGQSHAERGFRFLKDPVFFVSSLFIKKPSRIEGLLMVMTLALLVYSVAQRRLRQALVDTGQTLPNQIGQPTQHPTLRWIFQLLEGIHRVVLTVEGQVKTLIEGITDIRRQILRLLGQEICQIYQISSP